MTEKKDKATWHGIPREEIPWLPTVDKESCIGCQLCYVTCGRDVYEMHEGVAEAVNPLNCAFGCSTCANVCPTSAISFPTLDAVWKLERERQIFRTVRDWPHTRGLGPRRHSLPLPLIPAAVPAPRGAVASPAAAPNPPWSSGGAGAATSVAHPALSKPAPPIPAWPMAPAPVTSATPLSTPTP